MKIVRESLSLIHLINENMQQARSILKKLNIPESDPKFQDIKQMLLDDNRIGYIGKFTKWIFKDHESMEKLREVYEMLKEHPKRVPPIDTFKTIEDLYDYLQGSEISTKTNQIVNAIPSRARKNVTEKLKKLIELNIKYADQIRDFYSKKGGKFKSSGDLYEATENLIRNLQGDFNLDAIKEKIRKTDSNVEIILESPELLILRPIDFETAGHLGSESWCICTSRSYWDSYCDIFSNQYFVYDFTKEISDKRAMIGVTINPDGSFKACHFKDDSVASKEYLEKLFATGK